MMHCGVMVTGYNQADWPRLLAEDYSRGPDIPDSVQFDATLELGELVEPLGFDSIWATEHYGSAYSMQPNPLQYLAYWAGRTQRVDVGTAVIVVPWWNPVRLASELSMLDMLLKGRRLHLGLGRGVAPHEYASIGVPQDQSHRYFYEIVDILTASDGSERFEYHGDIFKVPPTTIRPQARHKGQLTTEIRVAGASDTSSRLAAEHGFGQMFVADDNLEQMSTKIARFNGIRAGLGLPPDQPTTLLWMYCAETEEEAHEGWTYYANQMRAVQHHYFEWNNPGFQGIAGMEHYLTQQSADVAVGDGIVERHRKTQPIGTPAQIIECIERVQWAISLEKLVIHFFYGGMPKDKAERSLRLFAQEVLPAVHRMDTPINPLTIGPIEAARP
jgi:alkanesulfonate monooxygenase SsuD/methylene tetrahydromethanopterin reductase-like flavin-dependent oxidoreductase (luciferase family)